MVRSLSAVLLTGILAAVAAVPASALTLEEVVRSQRNYVGESFEDISRRGGNPLFALVESTNGSLVARLSSFIGDAGYFKISNYVPNYVVSVRSRYSRESDRAPIYLKDVLFESFFLDSVLIGVYNSAGEYRTMVLERIFVEVRPLFLASKDETLIRDVVLEGGSLKLDGRIGDMKLTEGNASTGSGVSLKDLYNGTTKTITIFITIHSVNGVPTILSLDP